MDDRARDLVIGDAFGEALLAHQRGEDGSHVIERDDGLIVPATTDRYFAAYPEWRDQDKTAVDAVGGRILDVGAGAGRATLELADRGCDVVAIDTSPGAVSVCRERGIEDAAIATVNDLRIDPTTGFDAILLLGGNLGILGSVSDAGRLFSAMARLLRPGGRVLGTCADPHDTDDPVHLEHHAWNREHGRLPGQTRLRVRHRRLATEWFDWLFTSPEELAQLANASGWELVDASVPDPVYLAALRPR